MAAIKNPGKSEFVKDVLSRNSKANAQAVNEAWTSSGHEGTISTTLVQKMRASMGLTRSRKARKPAANGTVKTPRPVASQSTAKRGKAGKASSPQGTNGAHKTATPVRQARPAAGTEDRRLVELEGDIDRLIFRLIAVGGLSQVEDALRQARRLLIRSQKA
jgi:hypothetical protein